MFMLWIAGFILTIVMVGGFSYCSGGFVRDWFEPVASKELMRRIDSRKTTKSSYRRY